MKPKNPRESTGHGTGLIQARTLGRRRRMKGVTVRHPAAALVLARTRRTVRLFPQIFRRRKPPIEVKP